MTGTKLTGFEAHWLPDADGTLVLANGEDEAEVIAALRQQGTSSRPLGRYRGFLWHRLEPGPALLCVAGVGPPNVELAFVDCLRAGLARVVRFATCGSVAMDLDVGHVVVAREGVAFYDGVASVGAGHDVVRTLADTWLLGELQRAMRSSGVAGRPGVVGGTGFFHAPPAGPRANEYRELLASGGVDALDMETGTLLWLARAARVRSGSVVGVANRVGEDDLDGPAGLLGAARVVSTWLRGRAAGSSGGGS